jgi:hypothetical protein
MKLDVFINCPVVERSNPVAALNGDAWHDLQNEQTKTHSNEPNSKKKAGWREPPQDKSKRSGPPAGGQHSHQLAANTERKK